MIYLILAILCSSLISVLMRISQEKRKSDIGMFIFNYAVCSILGLIFTPLKNISFHADKFSFTIILGVVAGVLYLASFALFQQGIKKNGIVLASIFMKLGVLIPVLMSIIIFRESPKILQIVGIVLSIAAIIVFNFDKKGMSAGGKIVLLILLLVVSGFTDSMVNIYNKTGNSSLNDFFLFLAFFFAGISSVILYFVKKEKMGWWDVLFGVIIGIPNYFSSRFLLLSLRSVPAVVTYPVYSVATILVITLVGIIAFKEPISKQKVIGLILVVAAVAALA